MRYILFIVLLCASLNTYADRRHRARGEPRTEVGLINNVLGCLSNKDSLSYFYLFPPFDTLWALVIYNRDPSPDVQRDLNNLKAHPQSLLEFDPYFNHNIIARFMNIVHKGEDSGIHWNNIVVQRYELTREANTDRKLAGYDRIVPERFKGYMFVRDLLGRLTFCITITEIQKINGYFFGGQVMNILEASTVDQYLDKEEAERKYFDWLTKNKGNDTAGIDSAKLKLDSGIAAGKKAADFLNVSPSDDDSFKARREVVDRKYYEGKFDDEIPVALFLRYMKDLRTGAITGYDGLYKFGDMKNYVRLHITKGADGKWMMEDDIPIGTMELELKSKVYTGSWTNNENQTGYDVVINQVAAPARKIEMLDRMLETGKFGRVDDARPEQKENTQEVEGVNPPDDAPKTDGVKNDNEPKKAPKPKKVRPKRTYDDD
jgi:hypothetical protein